MGFFINVLAIVIAFIVVGVAQAMTGLWVEHWFVLFRVAVFLVAVGVVWFIALIALMFLVGTDGPH